MSTFVEVQTLAGKQVRDSEGRAAGRIESIMAERIGPRCSVYEYRLGVTGLLTRMGMSTLRMFGWAQRATNKSNRVPWDHLDLSDPEHPRLRCTLSELQELQKRLPADEE